MIKNKNIFLEKKILIYGLGKSGIASYKFLKNKDKVYLFNDDLKKIINNPDLKGHYYFTESFINKYISENIMDINPDLK